MENLGLFETYLDGNLTETEQFQLINKLSIDSEFEKEFSIYNEINNSILNQNKRDEFKSVLETSSNNYFRKISFKKDTERKIIKISLFSPFKLVASVTLFLIIVGSIWYFIPNSSSNNDLYQKFYSLFNVDVITRSVDSSVNTADEVSLIHHKNKFQEYLFL
jgi:hypothetical protein